MHFKIFKPEIFKDLVDCIWVMEHTGDKHTVLTLPNQYYNITFSVGTPYYRGKVKIENAQINGLEFHSTDYTHMDGNKIIGIRLMPYGLYSFINCEIARLNNRTTSLNDLIGNIAHETLIQFIRAKNEKEYTDIIYAFLYKLFDKTRYKKLVLVKNGCTYFREGDDFQKIADLKAVCNLSYTWKKR